MLQFLSRGCSHGAIRASGVFHMLRLSFHDDDTWRFSIYFLPVLLQLSYLLNFFPTRLCCFQSFTYSFRVLSPSFRLSSASLLTVHLVLVPYSLFRLYTSIFFLFSALSRLHLFLILCSSSLSPCFLVNTFFPHFQLPSNLFFFLAFFDPSCSAC